MIVEVDDYAYHRSPTSFQADRERDALLTASGWRVLGFTWAQITRRTAWVARAISSTLAIELARPKPRESRAWSHSAINEGYRAVSDLPG